MITSCKKTPVITLSVDKTEISADGVEIATFKVICDDDEDVTKNCRIFFSDTKKELGATTFSTTEPNTYSFYATYEDATSNTVTVTAMEVEEEEPGTGDGDEEPGTGDENEDDGNDEGEEPSESTIVITADKTSILNDGKDNIIFTVTENDVDITTSCKIYVGDTKLKLNSFTSTEVGTYIAYAMKGEVKSNKITVTVEEPGTGDEEPGTGDGDEDENEDPENPEDPETPEEPEIPEEPEQPEPEKPITLTASTTSITANGSDAVTFTVMQENNDVTSQSNIFVNGGKLNGNKFTTYTAGTYTAYAKKNDATSNEITIYVEAVADMGKTIVFAEGVSISSGWYDVNKLTKGGEDVNMCWAAASANIIQWWQDRYVAAGNTLPSTAITGAGTKTYNGTKYNLAIMEAYRDLWDNSRGGSVSHGVTWYFEGRNIMKEASAGTHAQPLSNNTGGYYANDWNKILPNIYHGYDYVIVPGILEYNDLISGEFNNYSIWGGGSGLSGNASLKKFSDLVVEFIDKGMTSLTVALAANLGSIHHATTLWGYEIDNSTGILTKVWLTDSDDMHQTGESGNPTEQKLREYTVSYNDATGTIKFSGAPYGACYAVSLYPVSGYGSR